jgi:hypothetical protein
MGSGHVGVETDGGRDSNQQQRKQLAMLEAAQVCADRRGGARRRGDGLPAVEGCRAVAMWVWRLMEGGTQQAGEEKPGHAGGSTGAGWPGRMCFLFFWGVGHLQSAVEGDCGEWPLALWRFDGGRDSTSSRGNNWPCWRQRGCGR